MRERKKATLGIALIPIIFLVIFLFISIQIFEIDVHIPLFMSGMFAAAISVFVLGITWKELEEGIVETIGSAMGAIIILMIIGMVVGSWIQSGVVPVMIYYGLKILSPSIFLVASLLICSVVALATGSSWTTAATIGIALMGIGAGLGIPAPMIAGSIISGAYFGDKMSPLSDTTNLSPAMAGADLFDHIKHMIYTTGPSYIITAIVFIVLGIQYSGSSLDTSLIAEMNGALEATFNLNPLLIIIPIITITAVIMKVPAIPGLFGGALLGSIAAIIIQKVSILDALATLHYGVSYESGSAAIDELLNRGGMDGMMWTISLILCAMIFGGIMDKSGMLEAIVTSILKVAKGTGALVTSTVLTCIFMNFCAGDQYLAIVVPGKMFRTAYEDKGLAPRNLSRVLEDAATLTSPLIPWNTCGAYMITTLGIEPWTYIPYCVLNWLNPIISIFYGFTGITMMSIEDDPSAKKAA